MNSIIEDQLHKLMVAKITAVDETGTKFYIQKSTLPAFEVGRVYLIEIKNLNLNMKYQCYKCEVTDIINNGRTIKIDAIGYDKVLKCDIMDMWSGYLDISDIEVLEKL